MLFGPCTQNAVASFLPATSFLLWWRGHHYRHDGDARHQCSHRPAKTLGGGVQVVDTLAVRMVTDNIVIQFVPSGKRDGLTIERRSGDASRTYHRASVTMASGVLRCMRNPSPPCAIDWATPEVLNNNMAIRHQRSSSRRLVLLATAHSTIIRSIVGFLKLAGAPQEKDPCFVVISIACVAIPAAISALDRKAILDADLTLMMASEPAIVADHAFTTAASGRLHSSSHCSRARDLAFSTALAASRKRCPARKIPGRYTPDDSSTRLAPLTWSRIRAWWCLLRAATAA